MMSKKASGNCIAYFRFAFGDAIEAKMLQLLLWRRKKSSLDLIVHNVLGDTLYQSD